MKHDKQAFEIGLKTLGFQKDTEDCFYLCENLQEISDSQIKLSLDTASQFGATAVYFIRELSHYKPQVYIFDFTGQIHSENVLTEIQKKIWSNGTIPLVCIFYDTEIKIIDCTTHIEDDKPVYLIEHLALSSTAHHIYNNNFAVKLKSGTFWEEEELKGKFKFDNSAYDILIQWIKKVTSEISKNIDLDYSIINKIIIQSILIKYLEERQDEHGKRLFNNKYFKEYGDANNFTDVLKIQGEFVNLLNKLHSDFNGNIFDWKDEEKNLIKKVDLSLLGDALDGYTESRNSDQLYFKLIKYYEFSYVPVELISRLYEEFLGFDKHAKGLYYTPSHLAKLLVDETMPLANYENVVFNEFKILDPACGSGIFLVLAFKRLVQWWRLKNNLKRPTIIDLKILLSVIYGVDKEQQATKLAAFSLSLALCDELSPMQIISDLTFDDLTEGNILNSDFFIDEMKRPEVIFEQDIYDSQVSNYAKIKDLKFSVILGNPPFKRSGDIKNIHKDFWKVNYGGKKLDIPSKQIALKFYSKSLNFLSPKGIQCLILKSSGLIYNSTASEYRKGLFSNYNILQVLDFTALARNKTLWDNGADVDTIAVFAKNETQDYTKNLLHITFRRTKLVKERISFEISDYDLHFISKNEAINNSYIWKNNLVGGGRIKSIVQKLSSLQTLGQYLDVNKFNVYEGEGGGKSLHNNAFLGYNLDNNFINSDYNASFKNPNHQKFTPPYLLIKENIALPLSLCDQKILYSNEVVAIHSENLNELKKVKSYFKINYRCLQFYIICTGSKNLIYKNTAILKADIMRLPFHPNLNSILSDSELNIIDDVVDYYQMFLRNGENSDAVKPIDKKDYSKIIAKAGNEFSNAMNVFFGNQESKFRLSDVLPLYDNKYIATIYKFDNLNDSPVFHSTRQDNKVDIEGLSNFDITANLKSTRVIKIYGKSYIIYIKPNQLRYWLSINTYRDADKSILDLSKRQSL